MQRLGQFFRVIATGRLAAVLAAGGAAMALAAAMAPAAAVAQSSRIEPQAIQLQPRIVNGVSAVDDYPAVGQLLSFADGPLCSGTLIGCGTFLTAADCFGTLTPDPDDYYVFLPHAGLFSVQSISLDPLWSGQVGPNAAVLEFLFPTSGIPPVPINTAGRPPFGTEATIVGFGGAGGLGAAIAGDRPQAQRLGDHRHLLTDRLRRHRSVLDPGGAARPRREGLRHLPRR